MLDDRLRDPDSILGLPVTACMNRLWFWLSEYRVEEGDRLRRALFLNSEVEVIPNAGHWLHGQYPERVAELVFSHVGE